MVGRTRFLEVFIKNTSRVVKKNVVRDGGQDTFSGSFHYKYVQGCEKNVVRDGGQYGLLMPLRIVEGYRCVFEGKKKRVRGRQF